jgi:hypothetical protein
LTGCKSEPKKEAGTAEKELSVIDKIAQAHGFENWKNVHSLQFTFNVDRDTAHFERHWNWNVKTNEVTGISMGDTIQYNRKEVDSTVAKMDGAFVNDKYWLLAPINISWDKENITQEHSQKATAPISGDEMQKLTVVYGSDGGYTPGDAYDFYFGDDYMVREWVFRRGNNTEPAAPASWEGYEDKGGLKIATMHKNNDPSFKLYFTDLEVNTP